MPYQLRDQHGASRSTAYLAMTAAPFIFLTFIMVPGQPLSHLISVLVTSVSLAAMGIGCRWFPQWMPQFFWLIVPFYGIMVTTGMNLVTEDASTGAQLFYLWPVLYAANFLSRRVIYIALALMSITEAWAVLTLLPVGDAIEDWVSLTVAMSLTAFIVWSLRHRNDKLREVLETQALADALTGVANRRSFGIALSTAIARAERTGESLALLTLDVDHFKKINDTWGHAVGDQALQVVANALESASAGDGNVVARLGGDEFVVLLRADRMEARRIADGIREVLARDETLPGGPPGLSIGVAVLPDHAGSAEELIGASDAALYEAKTGGRGRTAIAHPPTQRQNVERPRATVIR